MRRWIVGTVTKLVPIRLRRKMNAALWPVQKKMLYETDIAIKSLGLYCIMCHQRFDGKVYLKKRDGKSGFTTCPNCGMELFWHEVR